MCPHERSSFISKEQFVCGFSKRFTKHSSVTVSGLYMPLRHRHVKTKRTENKSWSMIITMCVWHVLEVEAQIWDEISNPLGFTVCSSQTYCYVSESKSKRVRVRTLQAFVSVSKTLKKHQKSWLNFYSLLSRKKLRTRKVWMFAKHGNKVNTPLIFMVRVEPAFMLHVNILIP